MNEKAKDILIRAIKTFIQGSMSSFLLLTNNLSDLSERAIKSALIGALASGISAVMNLLINLLDKGEWKYGINKIHRERKQHPSVIR